MNFLRLYPNLVMNKRKIFAGGLIAFLGGILIGSILLNFSPLSPLYSASGQPLLTFSSYEELVNFVNTTSNYPYYFSNARLAALDTEGKASTAPEYSTTNIQVEGVDEADIVKTDGTYLFVISNQSVFILKASPEDLRIVSQIKLNRTLHELFINGDKLVVFGSSVYETYIADLVYEPYYWPYPSPRTFINVYNISNIESPVLARNITLDGSYFNSRMIGDYVYTVINELALLNGSKVKLPIIYPDDGVLEIQATDIHYSNAADYGYMFTTIVVINVQNDAEESTHETILLGATRSMYVSLDNIYITLLGQRDVAAGIEKTLIYRIHIEAGNIESEAGGAVPGYVLNQFSMDEYNGYFRIATTAGSSWSVEGSSRNNVYVLNMSLVIVGRLENLALTERIYSARFMGNKCYLVTFKQVDPFFVIDLSNPVKPEVLGYLKIPGFSSYLHPYDENHIIGIGKLGSNVKMSLFNVTDVTAPTETATFVVQGDWSDSTVLRDHKAFLFDKSKQLLALPVSVSFTEVKDSSYYRVYWQGAYVFNTALEQGFVLKGNVTHQDTNMSYVEYGLQVQRILYIENVLYTISDKKIRMNSLDTLDEIGEIELS